MKKGCKPRSVTVAMTWKAVTGNDHSDWVTPSQSPIELTLDNEPFFKYRSF